MVTDRKFSFATTIGNWKWKLSLQAWPLGEEQKRGKSARLASTHNFSVFEFFYIPIYKNKNNELSISSNTNNYRGIIIITIK